MIICNCILHIELPYVQSLKGRRSVTSSIKEKLKAFITTPSNDASVLDVSGEYAKEADIAFVFLSRNFLGSVQYCEKIEKMLERNFYNMTTIAESLLENLGSTSEDGTRTTM